MNSFRDRYLNVQADDVLVAQRGRLLNILVLVISMADLLTMLVDMVSGRPAYLVVEASALVVFGVIYRYTRRGNRWPPYVFLTFMAVIAPYAVRESFDSPIVLIAAVPVVVAPLVAAPWLCIPIAGAEAVMLYALNWASDHTILNPVVIFTLGVLAGAAWLSSWSLENAFREAQRNASDLAETNRVLEANRVLLETRTHDLERRSAYQEASAEVGHAATSILETDRLIAQAVELIRERFDLYYVGLFLVDERGEWAVLRAGTGEAGRAMLARGHQLQIGNSSMIGWSIANTQVRVALDAGRDAVRQATAELPNTRSEAALPLRSRGRVIGALTVQSDLPDAFDTAAISVLETMADQVAVAIDNARLFFESQSSLEAARRAYGELSYQAWTEILNARPNLGLLKNERGVSPADNLWRPEMQTAIQTGETVLGEGDHMTLATPIKMRGHVIGVIEARMPEGASKWTRERVELVETLTEQLGTALESARLYQDTQRRAARERLVGEITAHVRESLDVDRVLQTAVREFGKTLGVAEVKIRLAPDGRPTVNNG